MRVRRLGRPARLTTRLAACALLFGTASPAQAYLKQGFTRNNTTLTLSWNRLPVRYFVTDRGVTGVSAGQFQQAVTRAFTTWQNLPTSSIAFEFAGFTAANPLEQDNASTLGFQNRPELERVLAQTSNLIDTRTGEIVESDIFFNSSFGWSVAAAGEANRFDIESIAVHEVGHLFGLGHSAIGETEVRPTGGRRVIAAESVMFPVAFSAGNIEGRTLRPDDIAGVSDIYPEAGFRQKTGTIAGQVTKDGRGVFGAHVVVFSPQHQKLVAGFSLDTNGEFAVASLDPGYYIVRVEPLDDGDLESFFARGTLVDADFRVTYADTLAVVPSNGNARRLTIKVRPK